MSPFSLKLCKTTSTSNINLIEDYDPTRTKVSETTNRTPMYFMPHIEKKTTANNPRPRISHHAKKKKPYIYEYVESIPCMHPHPSHTTISLTQTHTYKPCTQSIPLGAPTTHPSLYSLCVCAGRRVLRGRAIDAWDEGRRGPAGGRPTQTSGTAEGRERSSRSESGPGRRREAAAATERESGERAERAERERERESGERVQLVVSGLTLVVIRHTNTQ